MPKNVPEEGHEIHIMEWGGSWNPHHGGVGHEIHIRGGVGHEIHFMVGWSVHVFIVAETLGVSLSVGMRPTAVSFENIAKIPKR